MVDWAAVCGMPSDDYPGEDGELYIRKHNASGIGECAVLMRNDVTLRQK